MLIVGRAVAGAGASALFSGGMTIVGFSVPLAKRPIFIAALSSMFGISSVVGPLLGGALTDKVSWRWCFWVSYVLLKYMNLTTDMVTDQSPFRSSINCSRLGIFQAATAQVKWSHVETKDLGN